MSARPRPGQGEALLVWAVWALVAVAVIVTYSRLDPDLLYNVSRDGVTGGLSRALVFVNYPLALVAITLVLIATAALPPGAWWFAAPALVLCALVPFVVDQGDLDARVGNGGPALGVLIALGLTVAASRRAGTSFSQKAAGDPVRVVIAIVVVLVALPWFAADLGFYFPGDLFMGEELRREKDGSMLAAVHLGQHHGQAGALLLLSALALSRMRLDPGARRAVVTGVVALTGAYGLVNMTQDAWNEQLWKRGWVDDSFPSAILPRLHPIWAVILVLTGLFALALRVERSSTLRT